MVLKIRGRNKKGEFIEYKSSKRILTSGDIEEADRFDDKKNKAIKRIEKILLEKKLLSKQHHKRDPLQAWYIIGTQFNKLLRSNKLIMEDENLFWQDLYSNRSLINKKIPSDKLSPTRNDYKTASLLALYPFGYIKKVGPWALWREIITYKVFRDKRILEWTIEKLLRNPRTRDEARPLLKAVANRFKSMDTSILNSEELLSKLEEIHE